MHMVGRSSGLGLLVLGLESGLFWKNKISDFRLVMNFDLSTALSDLPYGMFQQLSLFLDDSGTWQKVFTGESNEVDIAYRLG